MNICPKCGLPFEKNLDVNESIDCDYCGWSGDSGSTYVTGNTSYKDDELVKLRRVFVSLAREISPQIMQRLIREDIIKADINVVPRMVPILAETTRAMFSALIAGLCKESAKRDIDAETKTLHS